MITLCLLAAADTVLRAERGQAYRWMSLAAAALAALAVLAKGLIGVVLPGAILFLWLAWGRRWRGLARCSGRPRCWCSWRWRRPGSC